MCNVSKKLKPLGQSLADRLSNFCCFISCGKSQEIPKIIRVKGNIAPMWIQLFPVVSPLSIKNQTGPYPNGPLGKGSIGYETLRFFRGPFTGSDRWRFLGNLPDFHGKCWQIYHQWILCKTTVDGSETLFSPPFLKTHIRCTFRW